MSPDSTQEPTSAAAALAAQRHGRWIDMGQHETSIFDLIAMLIPMQAAGTAAVFAFQWRGWGAAMMAPLVVTLVWVMIGVGVGRLRRASSGPTP